MHSPFWKPGILLVFVLFSCLISVESVLHKQPLQKKTTIKPSSTSNGSKPRVSQKKIPMASTKKISNGKPGPKPGKPPVNPVKNGRFSTFNPPYNPGEWEKQEFLAAHNKIRFIHGEPPFTWDPKLALFAKQYAAQRFNDCEMIHSVGPYGENLFWGAGNKWRPSDAVKYWADEYRYYNGASNGCQSGKMCGHYTQIVWRDSVRLGCVRSPCNNGGTYFVCEYDPPGNYFGESPFDSHSR